MGADDSTVAFATPVDEEHLLCPLCAYDLRGLTEPRCPECGYQFVWEELRDRRRNTHPYLFEHHPQNENWSFSRTVIGGLNPIRFWKTLTPQMTPRPVRLVRYWLLCTLASAILAGAIFSAVNLVDRLYPEQGFYWYSGPAPMPPMPPPRPVFADNIDRLSEVVYPLLLLSTVIFGWTLATHLALLIFQDTMARARILPFHVARCTYYSFDVGIWMTIVAGIVLFWQFDAMTQTKAFIGLWTIVGLQVFAMFKLWMAYRYYLQFQHAFWVVLSSQIIAFLTVLLVVTLFHY